MSALSLDDAKTYLSITGATRDDDVQAFINAAEAAIARWVGPLESTDVTERVRGGRSTLILTTTPVISLTSVAPVNGTALTVASLNASPSGVVDYVYAGSFPGRFYDVAYVAGRVSVPADLMFAIREQVKHLWETQRAYAQNDAEQPAPVFGMLSPRVTELLQPHVNVAV